MSGAAGPGWAIGSGSGWRRSDGSWPLALRRRAVSGGRFDLRRGQPIDRRLADERVDAGLGVEIQQFARHKDAFRCHEQRSNIPLGKANLNAPEPRPHACRTPLLTVLKALM